MRRLKGSVDDIARLAEENEVFCNVILSRQGALRTDFDGTDHLSDTDRLGDRREDGPRCFSLDHYP
jgi:hypothetical protein